MFVKEMMNFKDFLSIIDTLKHSKKYVVSFTKFYYLKKKKFEKYKTNK